MFYFNTEPKNHFNTIKVARAERKLFFLTRFLDYPAIVSADKEFKEDSKNEKAKKTYEREVPG